MMLAMNARLNGLQKAKYAMISVFLVLHIVAICCWCLPLDNPLVQFCRDRVRPYMLWTGLFQSWDMFSPLPKAANTFLDATIIYKDGTRSTWTFPRMNLLGLGQRYEKERYRKFEDSLTLEQNDALLPDVARYLARLNNTPSHPVKTVILIQHWSFIVPRADGSFAPEPWDQHVLIGYGVRPEDLQ
jgi:hypothetical protein